MPFVNRTHLLARGLVGYWLMNEGCGNTVRNLANPSFYNGTLTNDASWAAGKFGSGIECPGTGDYVAVGDNLNPGDGGYVTILLWCKADDTTERSIFSVAESYGSIGRDKCIWLDSSGQPVFYVYNGYPQYATSSIAVTAGEWFQVVARVSGAGNQVFVNGVLGGTVPDGTSTFNGYTTAEVFIGGQTDSMPADFDGIIDHCVIWDRALSDHEIADLYIRPFAMFERPSIELWSAAIVGGGESGVSISVLAHHHSQMAGAL